MRNLDDQIATECRGNGGNCSIAQEQSPGAHLFGHVQSRQNRRCKHVDRLGDSGTAGDGKHPFCKGILPNPLNERCNQNIWSRPRHCHCGRFNAPRSLGQPDRFFQLCV
jgi:hypothetical protein